MQASEGYIRTSEGIRLYFQSVGEGPQAVVFPNGLYLAESFRQLAAGRTLVFYDVNRGQSDVVIAPARRKSAILKDVSDLETVRSHFGFGRISVIGHSYVGLTVVLYAAHCPERVNRIVQLSPIEPYPGKRYPPDLKWSDGVMGEVFAKIAELRKESGTLEPNELCRKFWALLRAILCL